MRPLRQLLSATLFLITPILAGAAETGAARPAVEADLMNTPACLAARRQFETLLAAGGPREPLQAVRRQTALSCFGREPSPAPEPRPAAAPAPASIEPIRLRPASALSSLPQAGPSDSAAPASPPLLNRCDAAGCWDSQGRHYAPQGSLLRAPDGRFCTRDSGVLNCP